MCCPIELLIISQPIARCLSCVCTIPIGWGKATDEGLAGGLIVVSFVDRQIPGMEVSICQLFLIVCYLRSVHHVVSAVFLGCNHWLFSHLLDCIPCWVICSKTSLFLHNITVLDTVVSICVVLSRCEHSVMSLHHHSFLRLLPA